MLSGGMASEVHASHHTARPIVPRCELQESPELPKMNALVGLLIVAATSLPTNQTRHPDAVEIFRCEFGENWDANFDSWPDHWTRRRGRGFPAYLKVELQDDKTAVAERSLRVDVDGGGATIYSPPISIDSRFSYVLEGQLRTEKLVHDSAYFSVTFYNGDREPLETFHSQKLSGTSDWTKVRIGPLAPKHKNVEIAVIGLHVRPGEKQDLHGSAMFDDVWFARLPRMSLSTNSEFNIYTDPGDVVITLDLSGILERDPAIEFEVLDASHSTVTQHSDTLDGQIIAQKSSKVSDLIGGGLDKPAGYAGTATWKPEIKDYGFYRARVTMFSEGGKKNYEREATLAIIRPQKTPATGSFGWSLPQGDDPLPLDTLPELLQYVGVNWLKFPVWYGEKEEQRGDLLMRFAERLTNKNIELVGLLARPPSELLSVLSGGEKVSAANIFSADPSLWLPSIDPVMTRLSLKIRWWQLGDDHDTSFVGYPDLPTKINEIRKQLYRFGQDVQLGLGWRWLNEMPADTAPPWEFLTLSADPPLTGSEMSTYLAASNSERARRWVLVEPLPRGEYSVETRALDLVQQMMSAKIHQADGIFATNPFAESTGLMNVDGTPSELLLPWRTTSLLLAGTNYIGSIRMPGGSQNHIFSRDGEAVMIVWNDHPTSEIIYLGEDIQQTDIWGRMTKPEQATPEQGEHRQVIHVGPLPVFISGINEPIVHTRMALKFQTQRMPSVFGKPHPNAVYLKNFFPQGVGGDIHFDTPDDWRTPQKHPFKMAAGEEYNKPFEITLQSGVNSGIEEIRVDFDLDAIQRYRFSVYRDLEVGLGDITIAFTTHLDNGVLVVEQRMTNHTDEVVDFKCFLRAPDRRRIRNQVFRLGRGQDIKLYRYPNGADLIGETLVLRAEEINGQRILNYQFIAEE